MKYSPSTGKVRAYSIFPHAAFSMCWGDVAISSMAVWWVAVPACAGRNVEVTARGGRLGAIDKPVGHRGLTGMWQQAGIGRDARGMHIRRPDEVVGREVIEVGNVLHHVVPDRAGPGDTDDVIHSAVVAIAGPDAHGYVGRVAHRPVVAEAIGRTGLGSCRAIQFQGIARAKFMVARFFVGEDAA